MRVVVQCSIWGIPNRPGERETFSSQIRETESQKRAETQQKVKPPSSAPAERMRKYHQVFLFFCNPPETEVIHRGALSWRWPDLLLVKPNWSAAA